MLHISYIKSSNTTDMKIKLLILSFLISTGVSAQTIYFDFGFYHDGQVTLCLKYGTACYTVFSGKLDNAGQATITLPLINKEYTGMATVSVGKSNLDFIVSPKENPVIRCAEQYPHGGNTVFENSPENESLQRWFMGQAAYQPIQTVRSLKYSR